MSLGIPPSASPFPQKTQPSFVFYLFAALVFTLAIAGNQSFAADAKIDPISPDAIEDPAYRRLIKEGLSEYDARHFDEARSLFQRAHELNPNARTYRGIGMASFELRDYVLAVHNLSAAIRDLRKPLSIEQKRHAQDLLDRSRMFVDVYTLLVTPKNARVLIDGRVPEYDVDGTVVLGFGQHALEASAPGFAIRALPINVRGGEKKELSISLEKLGSTSKGNTQSPQPVMPTSSLKETSEGQGQPLFQAPGLPWFLASGASLGLAIGSSMVWRHNRSELIKCQGVDADPLCYNRSEIISYRNLALGTAIGATVAAGAFAIIGLLQSGDSGGPKSEQSRLDCTPTLSGITCGRRF
jgi:hypothetical protein